jgi:hypothetical protein
LIHIRQSAPRRVHLLLFAGAVAASLVLLLTPRAAHASFVDCVGAAVHNSKTDKSSMTYRFRCSEGIQGYTIMSSQALGSFGTENVITDQSNAVVDKESFSCEGVLPSFGFGCNGAMAALHTTAGELSTDSDPCGKAAAKTPLRLWVVVFASDMTGDGKTVMKPSGPLPLSAPKCRKSHKKKTH